MRLEETPKYGCDALAIGRVEMTLTCKTDAELLKMVDLLRDEWFYCWSECTADLGNGHCTEYFINREDIKDFRAAYKEAKRIYNENI